MNILLIGSGGREHALAMKISQSSLCSKLFCTPSNAGIAEYAEKITLDVTDHIAVIAFCHLFKIGLVVVGPEVPLVVGLVDDLEKANILAFGPSRYAAQLEGSKSFTKQVCDEAKIPTAFYQKCDSLKEALAYLAKAGAPIVLKADGLAAGKGVIVAMTMQEAIDGLNFMFDGGLGAAGSSVVMEEYLEGEEISFFVITDGVRAIPFSSAQDHKRVFDGDKGSNTGGMGAYSPAPRFTDKVLQDVLENTIEPTLKVMRERGHPYKGVLYAGLMLTKDGQKLIEYNARFGDPECQVLLTRLQSDIVPLLIASAKGDLRGISLSWSDDFALTVVMAAKGYPGDYQKGSEIKGVEQANRIGKVFHAGTMMSEGKLLSNGGRVLNVTATGKTALDAQTKAYQALDLIEWKEGFCRRDIGWRAI